MCYLATSGCVVGMDGSWHHFRTRYLNISIAYVLVVGILIILSCLIAKIGLSGSFRKVLYAATRVYNPITRHCGCWRSKRECVVGI